MHRSNEIGETPPCRISTARLPEIATTRGGINFNPQADTWRWTDGVFTVNISFERLNANKNVRESLKRTLMNFAQDGSPHYLSNMFSAFRHLLDVLNLENQISGITQTHISEYSAKLKEHERGRLGTLNVLLQKWVSLSLPGVDPECAAYLSERRKPGNTKGAAVRTHDPITGPFSESEYKSLYKAVDTAYGLGQIPKWVAVLVRLLFASGGRISQYASMKAVDFHLEKGAHSIFLPQVKNREAHSRISFLKFNLSPQTGQLVNEYINDLINQGQSENSALFPKSIVTPSKVSDHNRHEGDLFEGHCTSTELGKLMIDALADIAPPTERLGYCTLPVNSRRFRYTFGTRLVEEGASLAVVAERLGHADLQNVSHYFEASPQIIENIDRTMDSYLSPLAAAFKGRLIRGEMESTHGNAPGSRIIDFRVSNKPIASCAGQGLGCSFKKPVACYTCFKFEPWLDAPHEKVLIRLEEERIRYASDARMAKINDDAILAIRQVIAECEQAQRQQSGGSSE